MTKRARGRFHDDDIAPLLLGDCSGYAGRQSTPLHQVRHSSKPVALRPQIAHVFCDGLTGLPRLILRPVNGIQPPHH